MKLLGYDAMAAGNHEFDHSVEVLMQQQGWAGCPFLSANIFWKDSGKPLFPSHTDFIFDGHTVRVVGFTTFRTPVQSSPGNTEPFEFRHEIQVASEIIPELRKGCDVLIGLNHIGHRGDKRMAATVDGLDLIVGGHSVTTLAKPVKQNGCYIVHAEKWGKYVGRADFILDSGKLELTSYKLFSINLESRPEQPRIAEDERVYEFLKTFQDKERDLLYQPIANTESDLHKSDLLSLITEAMRDSVESEHSRISLMNSGGCRLPYLRKGVIRYRDVLTVLPFSNRLCQVTLTGRELDPLLDAARRRRAWKLAGVTFEDDQPIVNEQPLVADKRYTFITNDFIASGGDGFPAVNSHPSFKLGKRDAVAFQHFLRRLETIKEDAW
jgi:5'-nucleotidase/UDP-sugar diphosphatase